MKNFCPNCGHEIKDGEEFCPNCGQRLEKSAKKTTTPQVHARRSTMVAPKSKSHKPMSKKNKILISVIAAVVVIVVVFFAWGRRYYNTAHQVDRITQAIRDKDNAKLAGLIVTDNHNVKVNATSVKALTRYYSGHAAGLNMLKNTLSNNSAINGISLTQDGHYLLFFPKYKLKVNSYTASVRTNHENSKVYVDGKYVATAQDDGDGEYTAKLKPMLGGKYNIKVAATASDHKISDASDVSLWHENHQFNFDIKTANLAVLGPVDGKVYVGNKYQGKINKSGVLDLNDFQYSDETNAYIVYKVGKNTFTSKDANVSEAVASDEDSDYDDDDDSDDFEQARAKTNSYDSEMTNIYPEFKGAPDLSKINDLLSNCFQDPDSDSFVNGSSNKYYKSFKKLADAFNDSDKIDGWEVEPDIYNTYPIGNGVFECDAKLDYKFEHDDDTHIQVAHYPHVTFEKVNGEFKILSVGNGKIIYDKTEKN